MGSIIGWVVLFLSLTLVGCGGIPYGYGFSELS